jgi:DNA-binding NarL/FixJ family response regulator
LTRARTRVLLIDEPGIVRDGLTVLLESEGTVEIVAAVATRREAVQVLPSVQPQVAIMDFSVALKTGPETVAHLKRRCPGLRVLVLTMHRDEQFIESALQAGADGYLLKTDTRTELFSAIERLSAGKGYISRAVLDTIVSAYAHGPERPGDRARPRGVLTAREQEVIALVARGYRTREMAQLMSLSHKTVEKHRTNLMRKLGLRSAAAVAAYAITHGFG